MKWKHTVTLLLAFALLFGLALPARAEDNGGELYGESDSPASRLVIPPIIVDTEVEINETNFPDARFRSYIRRTFGKSSNGKYVVNTAEVLEINCSSQNIQSLAGLELFTELCRLNCTNNPNLASLDVTEIPALLEAVENGELYAEDGVIGFYLSDEYLSDECWLMFDQGVPLVGYHFVFFDLNGGEGDIPIELIVDGDWAYYPDEDPEHGEDWFLGWYWNGELYDWDSPVTEDLLLVAEWGTPCTVTLDCAGGTIDGQEELTIEFCTGMTLRDELPEPEWEGKEFNGWLLNGEPYDLDQPLEGDVTLTASWIYVYTLIFDRSNPHDNGAPAIENLTVPAPDGGPVSFHYEPYGLGSKILNDDGEWQFLGWDTNPNAAPDEVAFPRYANGAAAALPGPYEIELNGDVTLYSIYAQAPTITIMKNDGSGDSVTGVVRKQGVYSWIMIGTRPLRDGYDLLGYSTNPEATAPDAGLERLNFNATNYVYYFSLEDVTLYAVWGDKQYALDFNLNGGEGTLPASRTFTMSDKPQILLPDSSTVSKAHRTLLGWAVINTMNYSAHITDVDYGKTPVGGPVYAPGTVLPAEALTAYDLTVYAVWQYEAITVSLNMAGFEGDYPTANQYPKYYNYGAATSPLSADAPKGRPATPNTAPPAKAFPSGYEHEGDETTNNFAFWLDMDDPTVAHPTRIIRTVNDGTALLPNDRDTVILAVWRYTFVSFYNEDETLFDIEVFRNEGAQPVLSRSVTVPQGAERAGCAFLGWAEKGSALPTVQPGEVLEVFGDRSFTAVYFDPAQADCVLPDDLTILNDEALAGTGFRFVTLNDSLTKLGSRVFNGCDNLLAVYVPESVTQIAANAFDGTPDTLVLVGQAGSAIATFAASHSLRFVPID